jgi:hypothetical protein
MHLTLKERLKLKVGNETNAMMTELMDFYTIRDMLLEYDKLRRGLTTPRLIAGGDNTIFDPSRAPEGAGVFYGVNFAPYDLFDDNGRGGGAAAWDARKEEVADAALAQYRKFYSNLTDDNITGRLIRSPSITSATVPTASSRVTSMAARRSCINRWRIGPRPISARSACRGSRGSIWWGRSCIRAAECSAPGAPRPSR